MIVTHTNHYVAWLLAAADALRNGRHFYRFEDRKAIKPHRAHGRWWIDKDEAERGT